MAVITPIQLLREATKAVPAVKYALGIVGIMSAIAIVASFGISLQVAVLGTVVMLFLMVMLVIFSKLTAIAPPLFVLPVVVFMWSSLVLTIVTAFLLCSSVFFRWPVHLQAWIASTSTPPAPVTTGPSTEQREATQARERQGHELLNVGKSQHDRRDFPQAWESLAQAAALLPDDPAVRIAQEDLAMDWLRNLRLPEHQTFRDMVTRFTPLLDRGVLVADTPQRKADVQAHIGWGMFLRFREGERAMQPQEAYQQALRFDANNPYAHAMLAHWLLWDTRDLARATQHFHAALATGRAETYVRHLQFSALRNTRDAALQIDMIRVANAMRQQHPEVKPPADVTHEIRGLYSSALSSESETKTLLQILPPAEHLMTLDWLFTTDMLQGRDDGGLIRYYTGLLQEAAGQRLKAQQLFTSLDEELGEYSTVRPLVRTALKRLTK